MSTDDRARELVARTAALARLQIPPEAQPELARQFARILEAFQSLGELDVEGVEPMTSPIEREDVLRDDRGRPFEGREDLLAHAPRREGDFFSVPKTVGGEG